MKNKILVACLLPYVLIVTGILYGLISWGAKPHLQIAAGIMAVGFVLFTQFAAFFPKMILSGCKDIRRAVPDAYWIPFEHERIGTEDKLHLVSDGYGVIAQVGSFLVIGQTNGNLLKFEKDKVLALCKARSMSTSVILVSKESEVPLVDFSMSPQHPQSDPEISGSPTKKVIWFAESLGIDYKMLS